VPARSVSWRARRSVTHSSTAFTVDACHPLPVAVVMPSAVRASAIFP
jgi:hypothetical protein